MKFTDKELMELGTVEANTEEMKKTGHWIQTDEEGMPL